MMMKMIGSATSAVLVAACMVATAVPARAATRSSSGGITVVTPASVTTYNGARAVIKPAVTVQSGTNKAVTASRITAYLGRHPVASGPRVKLRPGSYSVRTRVTYRTYKFVTKHRNVTTPVTHDPDGVANTPGAAQNVSCVVVAVQDGYPQTGTCTTPDYPGQTVTIDDVSDWCGVEDYAGTAVAGDIVHDNDCYGLSGSGDFHAYTTMQTVVRTYTVKQYTGAGHYTTPKQPLRVKDGGLLRMYSGAGVHATSTFTVPDHTWYIGYAFDCSGFGQAGNFIIYVYRGRHLVDVAANRLAASGTGANTEYGSGTYHLQVISECTWSVAVK